MGVGVAVGAPGSGVFVTVGVWVGVGVGTGVNVNVGVGVLVSVGVGVGVDVEVAVDVGVMVNVGVGVGGLIISATSCAPPVMVEPHWIQLSTRPIIITAAVPICHIGSGFGFKFEPQWGQTYKLDFARRPQTLQRIIFGGCGFSYPQLAQISQSGCTGDWHFGQCCGSSAIS